jgi:DNA-directed RNA polymerase subunit RPC12/RpoP
MGKLALWVTCAHCGQEFDTRLRLDRKSFVRGTLAANYHQCPHCGKRLTYRKADYLVREEPAKTENGRRESGDGSRE